ncbi:hypothetical protein [Aurantibacter aestuarii]|uniref:Uncharacterized protein n=1 Tax=Aurantibacter aestuarii TaxID=1266046 RepID=A0A2T1NDE3_9FLAO|nr:hypothetical protein [Aurantibacter aestuarii]PSG90447.1 hypothetical protein C7H52_03970 [Aurantibacter aestuarii]
MNYFLLPFFLLASLTYAQDTTVVKAPKIVMEQKINQAIPVNNMSVTLLKVLSDSRCPIGVTCIWAGEAKVLVEVITNGKKEKKEVFITSNGLTKSSSFIASDGEFNINAIDLLPYPEEGKTIGEYILKINVTKAN